MPFNAIETFESEMVARQLIETMHLLKQSEQIGHIYREVLFDALTPVPDAVRMQLLHSFDNKDCPFEARKELIGTELNGHSFVFTESRRLFHTLFIEMLEKGTHILDQQKWKHLQAEYVTKEAIQHLEFPFSLCTKLKIAYPDASEWLFIRLIPPICENNLSTEETNSIFNEISQSQHRDDLCIIIEDVLKKTLAASKVSDDRNATGTSRLQQKKHISMSKNIDTIHLINLLNNSTSGKVLRWIRSILISVFWLLAELSESTHNSIIRALQNFPPITVGMLTAIFHYNGEKNEEFLKTNAEGQLIETGILSMVRNFN